MPRAKLSKERRSELKEQRQLALGDQTTRDRRNEKNMRAQRWVYLWGWSSPGITDSYAYPHRRGVTRRLINQGLLKEEITGAGGEKGGASSVVALTPAGRANVEAEIEDPDDLLDYQGLRTLKMQQLRHDLLVQRAVARWMMEGSITSFQTPTEFAERSQPGTKHPDALIINSTGKHSIEMELTAKAPRRMDDFAWGVVRALDREEYDSVHVLSPSNAILNAYKRRFKPGEKVKVWGKDQQGRAVQKDQKEMPNWVWKRLMFSTVKV